MKRLAAVGVAVAALLALSLSAPTVATASSSALLSVGTSTLATPASGGRYLYVSPSGTDEVSEYKTWLKGYDTYDRYHCLFDPNYLNESTSQTTCPAADASDPLLNIQTAVRVAKPGDVIVVRAGSYKENVGWSALKGTASRPIILQAYPGEKVYIYGTLIMHSPDYWTVKGFHFVYNSSIQGAGEAIINISGGQHWIFSNNEVRGSKGVGNDIIQSDHASSGSVAALTAAAPRNYLVSSNCIHDNAGVDAQGLDHNIYLVGSIYQSGGVISHNLLANAPRGSNIKAAASSASVANSSPANVVIKFNTMVDAASGVTLGLNARNISVQHNIIAEPLNSQAVDGGIHDWALANPASDTVSNNLISGYTVPIHEDYGVTVHLNTSGNDTSTPVAFKGTISGCTYKPTSSTISAQYGQYSGS